MHDLCSKKNSIATSYFKYWGKARPDNPGPDHHLLAYHSLDVAAVGWAYLQRAPALLHWFQERFQTQNQEALISWITFWLALHDLGKFSISFQGQRADLVERLQGSWPTTLGLHDVRHDSLGDGFWTSHVQPVAAHEAWFGNSQDIFEGVPCWVKAVMGHHGQPPLNQVQALHIHFRTQDTTAALDFAQSIRELLLSADTVVFLDSLDPDDFIETSQELSWWIAGLTVLSDWIGSNAQIFSYRTDLVPLQDYWAYAKNKAASAIQECGVIPGKPLPEQYFSELFPHITTQSPLQGWAVSVPIPTGPQIYFLEDVTGAGKTEAALVLTHRLMAAGCADGFFVGLPTMATANAMYGRIAHMYDRLFSEPVSLALAHKNKRLVESFAQSILVPGAEEHDRQQSDDTATSRCARWLADHNKRALLAPAGVGTIDQALLGVLQSKHQSLRLLGLLHKVLVVDEVHACDAYMQQTLELLLEFHARAGGCAVLLSATMTRHMKNRLLKAFAKGSGQSRVASVIRQDYPLTTAWAAARPTEVLETPSLTRPDVQRTVHIRYVSDRAEVIQAITNALVAGQCVAWIRNTIGDALEAYTELSKHIEPDKIDLFHARFTLGDRLDIEERVLKRFGRDSGPVDRAGRLLIATQVAEQSLDIDVDLLVSDLAPIDRIIQRAGRLRRHVRDLHGNRLTDSAAVDQRGIPWMWILGPAWTDTPEPSWFKKALPKSSSVYPHHGQLWLTAHHLQRGQFTMPDDARLLIEGVFGDKAVLPNGLENNAIQAEGKSHSDRSFAARNSVNSKMGYQRSGLDWNEDTVAPSRLGEDTIDVLLGRWEGDKLLPWRHDKPAAHAWAYSTVRIAKRLMASTAAETDPTRNAVLTTTLEALPGAGKWIVMLPLKQINERYAGQVEVAAPNGTTSTHSWMYDTHTGLVRVALDDL